MRGERRKLLGMRTRLLGLALSAALASACGGGGSTPPPAPSPPAVSVLPHASPTIDTHFDVDVEVSGCDSVKGVTLSDGQTVLVQADNPLPRTTFTIPASQVNYKADGLAASLDLLATAECANGAK